MKRFTIIFMALLALSACSSTSSKRSVGEVIDDSVISNKIKVKYLKDKTVKGLQVNVDTWKGIVTLKGRVNNQDQIDRAIVIAERQPGVREVKSYLIIKGTEDIDAPKNKQRKGSVTEQDIGSEQASKVTQ